VDWQIGRLEIHPETNFDDRDLGSHVVSMVAIIG